MRPRTCWKNKQQLPGIQSKSGDVCRQDLLEKQTAATQHSVKKSGDVCGRDIVGKINSSYVVLGSCEIIMAAADVEKLYYCKGGNFDIHIWAWFGYFIC